MFKKMFMYAYVLFTIFYGVNSVRKMTSTLNPGCDTVDVCKDVILVHVRAEGSDDTLHYLWDFTGKPSIMLALTEKNASLSFNWRKFGMGQLGSVTIDSTPKYIYSVVLDQMIEFYDEFETGDLLNVTATNSSYVSLTNTKELDWQVVNMGNSSGEINVTIEASKLIDKVTNVKKNGTIRIVVSAYAAEEHSQSLPHLLHSGNASQLDITLDNLSPKFSKSRFGFHLIIASSDPANSTISPKSRKTMDDEHAPGVFTIVELRAPSAESHSIGGGYLQWRPVVYTSSSRDLTSSMESVQYEALPVKDPLRSLNTTLPFTLLGNKLLDMLVTTMDVTFGSAHDGFYNKNKYATWTVLVGYGHPPEEGFSTLVTMVLLLGLGVPFVFILVGTTCLAVKRLNRNKEDLYLSR